jgi:TPR repeat protein
LKQNKFIQNLFNFELDTNQLSVRILIQIRGEKNGINRSSPYTTNDSAQNAVGVCYEQGIGTAKNTEAALKYYLLSAEQGNLDSQNSVAFYYQTEDINIERAIFWYNQSAAAGNSFAKQQLDILRKLTLHEI